MLIFKNYRKFFKFIIILQILNVFLITSCTLTNLPNNDSCFNDTKKKLKKLIVPKEINLPKDKDYNIPYTDKDIDKQNYNIFPPISIKNFLKNNINLKKIFF